MLRKGNSQESGFLPRYGYNTIPALARALYGEIASYGKSGCGGKTEELREPLGVSEKTFQNCWKR